MFCDLRAGSTPVQYLEQDVIVEQLLRIHTMYLSRLRTWYLLLWIAFDLPNPVLGVASSLPDSSASIEDERLGRRNPEFPLESFNAPCKNVKTSERWRKVEWKAFGGEGLYPLQ
jgi:hypothetical protein